jgi:uncharacterized protein (TIGR00266 family)
MEIAVRHSPSFAVARATLDAGEAIQAEAGAMMATSAGVGIEARMQGGLRGAFKRSVLGGESLFLSTFSAPPQGGWVDVAARLPGDLMVLDVPRAYNLSRGSYLCSESSIGIDTKFGGFGNVFGGEGGFLVRVEGTGKVVASCYGALDRVELAAGETVVVDSGHMVAYSDGVEMQLRRVAKGIMQSVKSGEGFVFDFTGPGVVWVQSRNPDEFVDWLTVRLPFARE